MGRFAVGEKTIFIVQSFKRMGDFHFLYEPWSDKDLNNEIIVATCLSEHDVPVEYYEADGNTAKGYIFSDQHGRIWYNQYPKAGYGQIDDSADRMLILHDENISNLDSYKNQVKADFSKSFNDKDLIHDWYFFNRPVTLGSFVSNVFRFIIRNNETRRSDDYIRMQCNSLESYLGEMISTVEKEANCEILLVSERVKFNDKETVVFFIPPRPHFVWKE